MVKLSNHPVPRICQGDIIENVELIKSADIQANGILEVSKIVFPYVIVLSQDCDLEQDFNNSNDASRSLEDGQIFSIIVAPLYNFVHVCNGEHLSNLDMRMQTISSKPNKTDNKFLRQNQNPRYHYIEFPDDVPVVNSVIDFKHYFTVDKTHLEVSKSIGHVGKLEELYREQVSLRFANYLSRIGLPQE